MRIFSRLFKNSVVPQQEIEAEETIVEEEIDYSDSTELLDIGSNGILDTTTKDNIERFKQNLRLLIKKAKEENKVERFALIREDDYYPYGNEWIVNSNETTLESVNLPLSIRLRERYALLKANIKTKYGNLSVPPKREELSQALSKVDKDIASILMPVHFRSTKHFTINIPLTCTGNYNFVNDNRNFTIIDTIDNFLNSGYAYSVASHDAYLDVTHESLPISNNAIILINKEKYEKLKNDEELMNELKEKKVIIYKGEEHVATNMILTTLGILPASVGLKYLDEDNNDFTHIIDESIKNLSKKYNLHYDQGHGSVSNAKEEGHFTSRYDDMNNDHNKAIEELVMFLKSKFKEHAEFITIRSIKEEIYIDELIDRIGIENLINALKEYNEITKEKMKKHRESYLKDRKTITEDISNIFKKTTKLIDEFYSSGEYKNYKINELDVLEENIKSFFQAPTVKEQLNAAHKLTSIIRSKKELNNMFKDIEDENRKTNLNSQPRM